MEMIHLNNIESSQRNINIITIKNNYDDETDIKNRRNVENKSVILFPKSTLKYSEDNNSNTDPNIKINNITDSKNIVTKQNRPTSSKSNININSNLNPKLKFLNILNINGNNKAKNGESIYDLKIFEKCLICEEKLNQDEKENNFIECHHAICSDCFYNYLKEMINTNNVINIKCPQNDCNQILYNNFIEKMLINDIPLLDKYKKFVNRRQLILNPDIQLCPFPDCESYAKKVKNKYVCCVHNKHKFCLKCLKGWHGKNKCESKDILDTKFELWRNPNRVKKCPRCKYFIEKNHGCNHIICFNCRYEFCWLCLKEYTPDHYEGGICSGLQFSRFECLSNKLILYLRRIGLVLLKNLGFFFIFPFLFSFILYARLYEMITDNEDDILVLWGLSGIFVCFTFLAPLFCISSILTVLMLFIWPLHDKIFDIIFS